MLEIAPVRSEAVPPELPREPPRRKAPVPPPLLVAAVAAETSNFSTAPQAEPRLVEAAPSTVAATPAPIVPPRFDADYLRNPAPEYPAVSRRMGEEGRVVLRVRVSVQGSPLAVELKQSCGFIRLDEAARAAVEKWRFVPARQGGGCDRILGVGASALHFEPVRRKQHACKSRYRAFLGAGGRRESFRRGPVGRPVGRQLVCHARQAGRLCPNPALP
ncbi:MAG: TonB family protein [Sulfuritalea sp.]|nr:TonB family protein [Sulfuritalea sp.]